MELTFLILSSIFLLVFIKIFVSLYRLYYFYKKINKLPGPNFNAIYKRNTKKEERLLKLTDAMKNHKDGLFRTWLGIIAVVHVNKPEHVEIILRSTININKAAFYILIEQWLGQGLLTSKGQKWTRDRKMITPAFHFNILEQYAIVMSEKADIFVQCVDKFIKENPGKPIDIFPYANRCTLDIICDTAMGVHTNTQENIDNEYGIALQRFTELLMYRILRPWFIWDWLFALTKPGKEYFAAIKVMHNFTREVIRKRKIAREMHNKVEEKVEVFEEINKPKRKAFLDILLDARENNENSMTDEEIREQVDTIMFAGHDTTAAAVSWTLFCLGNHPEIQEKVHEELENIFGDSNESATTKEISQLKYLDRVTKEALRLYPSAPIFMRKLTEDIQIDEYTIPKDCIILLNPFVTHRHSSIWPNPHKFDPDRFLPEVSKNRHPYAYIPFSAGPRNCIGQKYAQLEEKFILTALLRKWKVKSMLAQNDIKFYDALILRPSEGIYIYFIPKK